MGYILTLTEAGALSALGQYLTSILPTGTEIVLGQQNDVPEPTADNFVTMTPLSRLRLSYTIATGQDATQPVGNPSGNTIFMQPTEYTVQLDIHGDVAGDNAQIFEALFCSSNSTDFFDASGLPMNALYTSEPRQIPFINGEQDYENRWTIDATFQINPAISVPQSFASNLNVILIEVETTYK